MLRMLEKYFEPTVIVTTLGAIIVFVFADVVARFAFSTSISVANELARLSFVYMIYFGVSYCIRERRHMRVTVLLDAAPPALRRWMLLTAELVFLGYSIAVSWLGVVITQQSLERGKILSATQWPTAVLYAAIIFSGALSAARLMRSVYRIAVLGDTHLAPQQDL
ncbi:TRAP transporter small permease [uncultured Paracoccus sp.]|jgi:TRAP-type C4-dicarboxylate transport system permease small subunit|uniref:TRAP transporter small permease n=1 Tax=Paracoccus sp. TaxID=267 RepID=UPI00183A2533|nr:TRAP transporter small permease [uncultured Paracoccus sp.]HIC65499.1 TRAP transporter small permease [Paracoccus sp. (in: a-proteobacteria)]|tara:strand:- start:411 stop:905 length:495 start_codon:yes stop_codon:yes gene_type:complete